MTQTEQLMNDLRTAIRNELVAELRTYRGTLDLTDYEDSYLDGLDDAANLLEQAA